MNCLKNTQKIINSFSLRFFSYKERNHHWLFRIQRAIFRLVVIRPHPLTIPEASFVFLRAVIACLSICLPVCLSIFLCLYLSLICLYVAFSVPSSLWLLFCKCVCLPIFFFLIYVFRSYYICTYFFPFVCVFFWFLPFFVSSVCLFPI